MTASTCIACGRGLIGVRQHDGVSRLMQAGRSMHEARPLPASIAGPVSVCCCETRSDRVTAGGKDDRCGSGRCLRRQRCGGAAGYDDRYAVADEIGCKRRQPI